MKKLNRIAIAISILGCSVYAIPSLASDFAGPYVGAGIGVGSDRASGDASTEYKHALAGGVEGGYNWDIDNSRWLFGLDAFYDQTKSKDRIDNNTGNSVNFGDKTYGVDGKIGYTMGNFMPYFKLGYGRVKGTEDADGYSANGPRLGLGAEYKFADHWSAGEEVTRMNGRDKDGTKLTNVSLLFSLKYYFASQRPVAAAPIAAAPAYTPPPAAEPVVVAPPPPVKPAAEKITVAADALFDFDKAVLRDEGKAKLDDVASKAGTLKIEAITAVGHADRFGSDQYNQKLSERRANSVKDYLVKKGIAADRIYAEGKGKTQPVTKPDECKGPKSKKVIACLQPDRRVVIEVIGTK